MSSIVTVLKGEIQRIARKEIRSQIEMTRKATAQHRREIATLKRQVKELEQGNRALRKVAAKAPPLDAGEDKPLRFSAKGLHSLRARLGLSAPNLAQLVGVSPQTIYNWEQKKSAPRAAQLQALASVRALSKRSALKALEASPAGGDA